MVSYANYDYAPLLRNINGIQIINEAYNCEKHKKQQITWFLGKLGFEHQTVLYTGANSTPMLVTKVISIS